MNGRFCPFPKCQDGRFATGHISNVQPLEKSGIFTCNEHVFRQTVDFDYWLDEISTVSTAVDQSRGVSFLDIFITSICYAALARH